MKRIITLLSLILVWSFNIKSQNHNHQHLSTDEYEKIPEHRTCGTMNSWEYEKQRDPEFEQRMMKLEEEVQEWIRNNQDQITIDGGKVLVTIPVVVHVVYKTAAQNISDAQINSQITALNKDYKKLNNDTTSMPAIFKPVFANVDIEFCLAQRDPSGLPTTGITRTSTTKTVFDISTNDAKYTAQGGHDIWNRNKYLNLWVVPSIKDGANTGILGYAQFPGGTAATDGVVICYNYFGTMGEADYPYNKGRTATHEIGHWLNLYHIWGDDGTACTGSDLCADTPNQANENYGCPNFATNTSCSNSGDMAMNYMDYTDDRCMYMFTLDQKTRIQATINGSRVGLKTSLGCQAVTLQTATPSNTSYCQGATGSISYTQTGTMNVGNVYTAQLSDSAGSFTSPINIGTYTGQFQPGPIPVVIPSNTIPGTHYKVRVVSSNPITTSVASTSDIIIKEKPIVTLIKDTTCVNAPIAIHANQGYTNYIWSTGSTIDSTVVSSSIAGELTYTVTVTNNGCSTVASVNILFDPCLPISSNDAVTNILSCSPNPTSNILTITLGDVKEVIDLEIINMQGIVVYSSKIDIAQTKKEIKFDFSKYSKGVYTVKARNSKGEIMQKVVYK